MLKDNMIEMYNLVTFAIIREKTWLLRGVPTEQPPVT